MLNFSINKSVFLYYFQYLKDLVVLAFPIFVGILGQTLIGITDVIVLAKYNIKALSAVGIAHSIFISIVLLGLGTLTAISIILANLRGKKQKTKKYLLSTLILSFLLACIFTFVSYISQYFISSMGFEAELVPYIKEYISIVSFSIIGIFVSEGMKQFLQSYEIVKFPNLVLLFSVVLNLIADIIFVFGFGIIPAMGVKGAAIATLTVRIIIAIILFTYIFKFIHFKSKINFAYILNIIKTGLPIGFALLLECLAFNLVTIFAGIESGILAAVNSILIIIASTTFILPLAVSTALSVKVSYWFGANKPIEVRNYSYTALFFVLGFMTFISMILTIFPKQIISIFTSDNEVIKIAIPLMLIVGAYQIFDGFQCVTGGILKGFKRTKTVTMTVLMGYWLIGAPFAYIFTVKYGLSLQGYWLALALSLLMMGLFQAIFVKLYYNKFIQSNSINQK